MLSQRTCDLVKEDSTTEGNALTTYKIIVYKYLAFGYSLNIYFFHYEIWHLILVLLKYKKHSLLFLLNVFIVSRKKV